MIGHHHRDQHPRQAMVRGRPPGVHRPHPRRTSCRPITTISPAGAIIDDLASSSSPALKPPEAAERLADTVTVLAAAFGDHVRRRGRVAGRRHARYHSAWRSCRPG